MTEITILTLFAGRWHTLPAWLWHFDRINYEKKEINLVWYCNSSDRAFTSKLSKQASIRRNRYKSLLLVCNDEVRVSENTWIEQGGQGEEHAKTIAELYNRAWQYIKTEYVLFLEDDVLAPPNTIEDLLPLIIKSDVGYASGVVFDRHSPRLFTWDLLKIHVFGDEDSSKEYMLRCIEPRYQYGIQEIGVGHFGLTFVKKSLLKEFKPRAKYGFLGCDIAYCLELREKGYKRLMNYNVRALHIDSMGKVH